MKRKAVDDGGDIAVDLVDRTVFDPHALPRTAEFLGHQHGEGGVNALSHLGLGHDHGDRVVGCDGDPAVERDGATGCIGWRAADEALARWQERPSKEECATGAETGEEEGPSLHRGAAGREGTHGTSGWRRRVWVIGAGERA